MINYIIFGAYSATITAAASFLCGYILQEIINDSNHR